MASTDARVVTNATACVVGDNVFKSVINIKRFGVM